MRSLYESQCYLILPGLAHNLTAGKVDEWKIPSVGLQQGAYRLSIYGFIQRAVLFAARAATAT